MKKITHQKTLLLLLIVTILAVAGLTLAKTNFNAEVEEKFRQEVASIPEITVNEFDVEEELGFVQLSIKDKGEAEVFYTTQGMGAIESIGQLHTVFRCAEYESSAVVLDLRKDQGFQKWFSFEVNNLQELVDHYDDILATLETFPRSPNQGYQVITDHPDNLEEQITCSIYLQ